MSTALKVPTLTTRHHLVEALHHACRRNATASIMFHSALGAKLGLAATDMRTMDVLDRLGPLTAGEIAKHTGLAPASVTDLVDRLEKRRFVRRVRDRNDRRRVIIELDPRRAAKLGPMYDSLGRAANKLFAHYSTHEIAILIDFLTRASEMVTEQTQRLAEKKR